MKPNANRNANIRQRMRISGGETTSEFKRIASGRRVPCQRRLERSQPGFVMPPLVDALPVDRPANLFGTGSMDAAFGLVKFNAGWLKVQFAELEDPPNAAFEVIENVLVLHTQHLSGQYAIPMLHQLDVGSVIAPDVLEAVGELLAGRKQLFEIAETAGHRLPPCVDNPGVRQHQVHEPDMAEVIRILVDELRPSGAVDGR